MNKTIKTRVSTDGKIFEIYNLKNFCKDNNLSQGHMSRVHSGKAPHHKKWTKFQ